jgi:hypothetical protein
MRLRTSIRAPERFEDEVDSIPAASNATKPAFPKLLREQTIPFDPHLPPAAFPSLTQANSQVEVADRISHDAAEPVYVDMMDIDQSSDHTALPIVPYGSHLGFQTASLTSQSVMEGVSPLRSSFLDNDETSNEEEYEVGIAGAVTLVEPFDSDQRAFPQIQHNHAEEAIADGAQTVHWTRLAPTLQVEIFENLCRGRSVQAASDILGLGSGELHDVLKHLRNRNKQINAEDQGIHLLQETQLNAILRIDHSLRLHSDGWRGHVANTRSHLPHISPRFDYFICNAAEVELARQFLKENGIDTCVLGKWGCGGKDNSVTKWLKVQDVQASESTENPGSAHTLEVVEHGTRSSSRRRRRPEVIRNDPEVNVTAQARGVGPVNSAATLTDSPSTKHFADDQTTTLAMNLWPCGPHLTKRHEYTMASMKTEGGALNKSSIVYGDEDQRLDIQSPLLLKTDPPKPPPQDSNFSQSRVSTQTQAPYGSGQPQRKDWASSHEAPTWSPIMQQSNSFSRPPSRGASYKDTSQPYGLPSVKTASAATQFSTAIETEWTVQITPAPQAPQHNKDPHLESSIAENGTPILTLAFDNRISSASLMDKCLNQGTEPKVRPGFPKPSEPPQTPRKSPPRGSNIIAAGYASPLQVYGGSLFEDSPDSSQSSASKQLTKSLTGAAFTSPLSAKKLTSSQPSVSPAEQSEVEGLLLNFQNEPQTIGEAQESMSATLAPASKEKDRAEGEALSAGCQASHAKKASEVIVAAGSAPQKATPMKVGNDGKARRRTYTKSERQKQKEAANAAMKASLGKGVTKKRATGGQDSDANGPLSPQTANQEPPALQTAVHIRLNLSKDQCMRGIRPPVETQEMASLKKINFVEDLHEMEGGTIELPVAIVPSNQTPSTSLNLRADQKITRAGPGDESCEDGEASSAPISSKTAATPKEEKAVVEWANAVVEDYQRPIAMNGRSALTAIAAKMKSTPTAETAGRDREPASRRRERPESNGAAGQEQETALAAVKESEFDGQGTPAVTKKTTREMKDALGNRERSTPMRVKKISGLAKEASIQTADGHGGTKAFRGNQYLNADRTPRLNGPGMPRTKRERPTLKQ